MKPWDEYEIKARYIPTFLSVVPLVQLLLLIIDKTFWLELISNISWMLIANVSLSFIIMLSLVQIQCSLGKGWIEESVFGKGGERFPTTNMLLYAGGLISNEGKERIRQKISNLSGCTFSSQLEEKKDPANARLQAREASGFVRALVGQGRMTIQYNIRYGFFRNLIAGIIWSSIGSIGCSVFYAINGNLKLAISFTIYFIIYLMMFIFKRTILENLAFLYADTLYNEFLYQNKGVN
ncbi:hypothetical protein [Sporomusa sphaeroides]|uniref:hypothetical protein n=1 Tax=Sporomusa sphaeroides TaxID=47679 RepID=UPI002CEF9E64|nr:hypothetical protein [Sporomusa sphaeroides]HML31957.1 hypothetical protein [Sporomusa sphaeroides]